MHLEVLLFVSKGPACLLHKATRQLAPAQKPSTVTSFSLNRESLCVPAALSLGHGVCFYYESQHSFGKWLKNGSGWLLKGIGLMETTVPGV